MAAKRFSRSSNPQEMEDAIRAALAGVRSRIAAGDTILMSGIPVPQPLVVKMLEELEALYVDTRTLKQEYEKKLDERDAKQSRTFERLCELRLGIWAKLGQDNPELESFGFAVHKARKQPTVEEKALALAKRRATRAARKVMGPKQRKEVTGEADSVTFERNG